jgi:proline dehydrogenase
VSLRRRAVAWVARGYVAGESIDDALRVAARLALPYTLGYWDGPKDDPAAIEREYLRALDALSGSAGYLSIKAPSIDDEAVERVAARARERGVLLHFDSLAPQTAERVLRLAHGAAEAGTDVGVTLPARWSRSRADAEAAVDAGVRVRVVRGQWPDPAHDVDVFVELARILAGARLAVATHDARLVRAALEVAADAELELLYGLPLGPASRAAAGATVRIYVPYGNAWLPYALAQARRNPRIAWWLARDAALGRRRL